MNAGNKHYEEMLESERSGNHGGKSGTIGNSWLVAAAYVMLVLFTVYVLLDTFVVVKEQAAVSSGDFASALAAMESGKSDGGSETTTADAGRADGTQTNSGNRQATESESEVQDGGAATSGTGSDDESVAAPESSGDSGSQANSGKHQHGGRHGNGMGSSKGGRGKGAAGSGSSRTTEENTATAGAASAASGTVVGEYSSDGLQVEIRKVRAYDTDIYIADVKADSAEHLATALAGNAFGRNIKATTSEMAQDAGAVLAVNGDYYGFRDTGWVVRNGTLYRDTPATGTDALVVYADGHMESTSQDSGGARDLISRGAWQVLSFGPTLVSDGQLKVDADDEVSQAMGSNPRTAIGMVEANHYVIVVSDGRSGDDAGLSLHQLAQTLLDNGCSYGYNLDGGGSTTLYFKGEVLNDPGSGNISGERKVSDIVYFK